MKEGFSTILRVNWTFFIIYQSGERKIWRHLDVLKKYILVDPGTPYVEDVGGIFFSLGKGMLSQTALLIVANMHVMLSSLKKITVYLVVQFNNTDHFTVAQKYASTAVVLELFFIFYLYQSTAHTLKGNQWIFFRQLEVFATIFSSSYEDKLDIFVNTSYARVTCVDIQHSWRQYV